MPRPLLARSSSLHGTAALRLVTDNCRRPEHTARGALRCAARLAGQLKTHAHKKNRICSNNGATLYTAANGCLLKVHCHGAPNGYKEPLGVSKGSMRRGGQDRASSKQSKHAPRSRNPRTEPTTRPESGIDVAPRCLWVFWQPPYACVYSQANGRVESSP